MSFFQVIFLLGSAAVAGPLLAHLLARPRFRPLPFAMMRFLQVGQRESMARRRLKNYLILLLRCLIIILLAMLFAGPRLLQGEEAQDARQVHYLGLDNSISMAYAEGGTTYFDKMREVARDYIREAEGDAVFSVFALASGPGNKGVSKAAALTLVDRMELAPKTVDCADFVAGLIEARKGKHRDDKLLVLMVSDFTAKAMEGLAQQAEPVAVDEMRYEVIQSDGAIDNAAIVAARVSAFTGSNLHVSVTLANYGPDGQERTLKAKVGGEKVVAQESIELPGARRRNCLLTIPLGNQSLKQDGFWPIELSLDQDDGLATDDAYYLAASTGKHEQTRVLMVSDDEREGFVLSEALQTLARNAPGGNIMVRSVRGREANAAALKWTDVVIAASSEDVDYTPEEMGSFLEQGGKAVFFVNRRSPKVLEPWWDNEVLPAAPRKFREGLTHIRPKENLSAACGDVLNPDGAAIKSLCSYKLANIVLTGYFECEAAAEAACLWRLENGTGFLYAKDVGQGMSVLVNTSADDSLGSLTKSAAAVAFCGYLLGQGSELAQHDFVCGEQIKLPALEMETRAAKDEVAVWLQLPGEEKAEATVADGYLWSQPARNVGWVKTLTKPLRCGGVNLPDGETDLTKPDETLIAGTLAGIFAERPEVRQAASVALDAKQYRPIWKTFAWLAIVLVLGEAFIANRMKR